MRKFNREKKIGACIVLAWIIGFSLFSGYQLLGNESHAIGGGIGFLYSQTTTTTTNATSSTRAIQPNSLTKGTWIIIMVSTFSPHTIVSSISDTASDSYSQIIRSIKYEDAAIWVANYTGTNNAANTVTINYNASTASIVTYYLVTGVISTTYKVSSGNGTGTGTSVTSFTPPNNSGCLSFLSILSNSNSAITGTPPTFWNTAIQQNTLGATNFHSASQFSYSNWQSYGATTDAVTIGGTSGTPQWDEVVACFQGSTPLQTTTTTTTNGMSAGIVQEKNSTVVTAVSNTLTLDYKPQQYNLLVVTTDHIGSDGTFNVTDNNGNKWKQIGSSSGLPGLWLDDWGANFTHATAKEIINVTQFSSHTFMFRAFELTGISSNWNTTSIDHTSTGTTLAASITSFLPPTNWFVLSSVVYNIGDSSAHTWNTSRLTQFNSNLSSMQGKMNGSDWTLDAYYPQWNLGATTCIMTPNAATSSRWSQDVIVLPTQTSGIVTNTLTTTTTTTTTNTTRTTTTSTFTSTTTTTTTSTNTSTSTSTLTSTSTSTATITVTSGTFNTTSTATTTNQITPQNGDFTFYGVIMLMAIIFSTLTFYQPSYGHYEVTTNDKDDKSDLESMFGVGRIFTKVRLIMFPALSAGLWMILSILTIVLLPQDSTGPGGSLDLAGGLFFGALGIAFIIITIMAGISLWAVHLKNLGRQYT